MTSEISCVDATVLSDLLDDRLPADQQTELTAHLETCEKCRTVFDELAAGSGWWGDLRRFVQPDQDADEFMCPTAMNTLKSPDSDPIHEERLDFLGAPTGPGHIGRFGPYEVLGLLGRGGMGVVLKAFDPALHRLVAIKVLAPRLASSAMARQRFAREARAVAAIAHEHIVTIHSVDAWEGLPYLVMQYVSGRSLQERIDAEGPMGVKEVLRIAIQTASGLAAAHARGVIHRDIKPSNILLENGVERVKISDFGLARAADDASLTQSGFLAGTPQYMAPEQAKGEPIDPRADLFSLGSVLYAACTGRSPFRAETTMGVLRRVCDDTPRPIREVNPDLPDWLAAIINRLLAKNPADRYQTAEELADLLEPFLAHVQQPSRFALPEFPERVAVTKRRISWAVAALVLAMLLGGLGVAEAVGVADLRSFLATILRIKTRDGMLIVEVEDPEVTVSVDDENGEVTISGAGSHELRLRPGRHQVQASRDGKPVLDELITITRGGKQVVRVRREPPEAALVNARETTRTVTPEVVNPPSRPATAAPLIDPFRNVDDRPLMLSERSLAAARPAASIWSIDVSADGQRIVTGESDGLRVYDLGSKKVLCQAETPGMTVGWVAFSPDGKRIASAEHGRGENYAVLRDSETARVIHILRGHEAGTNCVAFSPDGQTLASSSWDRTIKLWDVASGTDLRTIRGHDDQVTVVAFLPDGKTLASSSLDKTARLWEVATGKALAVLRGHDKAVQRLAISPDGKILATAGYDMTIKLWDLAETREIASLTGHDAPVLALAFSPDGKSIASAASLWGLKWGYAGRPSEIRVWDVATRETREIFNGNESHVFSVGFLPDGKTLASGSMDTTLRLWNLATGKERERLAPSPRGQRESVALALAYSPDGRFLASAGEDKVISLSDPATGETIKTLDGPDASVAGLAFSPDGKNLVSAGSSKTATVWDLATREPSATLSGHSDRIAAVAFSPDGTRIASAGFDSTVRLWEAATGKPMATLEGHTGAVRALAFSPDGQTLASGGKDRSVRFWSVSPPAAGRRIDDSRGTVRALAYSPDGKMLAIGSEDAMVRLWDVSTGESRTFSGQKNNVTCLAFSPTGATLASGGLDSMILLWNVGSGEMRTRIQGQTEGITALAFAPKGWQLASAAKDRTVKIWTNDVSDRKPVTTLNDLKAEVWSAAFSPDGKTLVWGGKSREILGSTPPGAPSRVLNAEIGATWAIAFAPDGSSYATAGYYTESAIKVWNARSHALMFDLKGHTDHVRSLQYSPDGKSLVSGSYDRTVRLWDLASKTQRSMLSAQAMPINEARFFPDGRRLAIATGDWKAHQRPGSLVFWDLDQNTSRILAAHQGEVKSLAISADGATVVTGGTDGIRVWDAKTGSPRQFLEAADPSVHALAFSIDGRYLASGHFLGDVVIWDAKTFRVLTTFKGHRGLVFSLEFSPDGRTLASSGRDKTLKLWAIPAP